LTKTCKSAFRKSSTQLTLETEMKFHLKRVKKETPHWLMYV